MSLNHWYCFPMNATRDFETACCSSSLELCPVGMKAYCWALSTGWSWPQACKLSQPKSSSSAANPYLHYLLLTAGKLPPMYCRTLLAQPGWAFVGGFCYSDVDSFTRNVRKLIYPSRHTEFKGKGHLDYVLTAQWGARHINSTELKTSTCNPEWIG